MCRLGFFLVGWGVGSDGVERSAARGDGVVVKSTACFLDNKLLLNVWMRRLVRDPR